MPRPLIAIPARFASSASALRYAAEVSARALVESVWRAGGEPVTIHPYAPGGLARPADVAARLARFDGVVLPGGGDLDPSRYGDGTRHERLYDMNEEQDGFDLEIAAQALRTGLPLLAICRGLQLVNTVLGGTLQQDMGTERDHRHLVHPVRLEPGSAVARVLGTRQARVSCYHHQRVDRPGEGLRITARAGDGTPEAMQLDGSRGWMMAVQWHPEDTAPQDPSQQRLFDTLIEACA
ncbi:gamma-glutamyl-gamma-aminobutyrate hydrolase family protein [Streptomyces clavuligerus]|uniref:Glutamine amidotransferase n=1 Tax=Streptomyces clavuligerus TaxID=1901 RepID=B5GUR6_STRCL|nr:gamma-glutamyl-gamma-aminobutyrate hydrolase family protein [Streptomyces clavuligerus]ANW17608.1 peptidase C26 [Streptomyces clavuligerus]AXU12160.1 gamma-glutamyl-gamma-aminobutyrate hydrolase family protein [Streptomyces clavuligerus]EDY50062.1 peptidase C26 [Streptomyces clavuligerus]EFG09874.1 Glutamine amidotransferase [Streptomyces clavuligerus]MBY6302026.1 gamma-glutamyl-gamma-aminobutyrate hydrolase family protein [Streptomyces clavuligerus]